MLAMRPEHDQGSLLVTRPADDLDEILARLNVRADHAAVLLRQRRRFRV